MRPRSRAGSALALLLGAAPAASAHLVTSGLGPVYDGIGHFFLRPEDIVAVFALALLAGLRGPAASRLALWLVPVGWLAGGLAGWLPGAPTVLPAPGTTAAVAMTLLIPGLLVAADLRRCRWLPTSVMIASASLHGFLNGLTQREAGPGAGMLALIGIAAATFVLVALAAALVVSLRGPWTRVVARVLGSWIAALGLLLLGWALRPK